MRGVDCRERDRPIGVAPARTIRVGEHSAALHDDDATARPHARARDGRRRPNGGARTHDARGEPVVRRLRLGESRLGERQSRGVHLPLVQWDPSLARGPRELRAKRDDGLVERRSVELDARGGERRDERVHGAVRDGRADADAGKVRERRRAGVARASEVRGERWGVETAEVVEVVGWESRGGGGEREEREWVVDGVVSV